MKEKFPYTYKREKQRFSIRKTKAWGACSVFLGTSILFLSAGTVARADTTADASTRAQVVVEQKTTEGAKVNSDQSNAAPNVANTQTNAVKADSTGASSSAVKADSTGASSSAAKAETTSASSSSAVKAETTSASSSSATKADSTSASSSSAVKTETTSASSQKTSSVKSQAQSLTATTTGKAVRATSTSVKKNSAQTKVSYSTLLQQLRTSKALASDEAAFTHVDKDNFLDYFRLNGSATYDAKTGIVTITPDQNNQVGNFSLTSKIDMNKSFTLTGQVNLGSNPNGADGIGFAFHNGNTTDVGNAGGNLGIGGLQDAIGFKLDTFTNNYQVPLSDKNGSEIPSTDPDDFGCDRDSEKAPYGTFVKTSNQEISAWNGSKVQRWWVQNIGKSQALSTTDLDGHFHDFVFNYDGATRELTVSYTQASGKVLTWATTVASSYQTMAMIVSASTGALKNLQEFKLTSFDFHEAATVNVEYVDTTGHQIAQGTVNYPDGAYVNGRYTTKQLAIPNYRFIKMGDKSLDANGTLNHAGDNGTVIYVYTNQGSAKVTYIDDTTGKTLSTKDLTGDYGSTDPYRTGDTIADYEKQGYQLVSDNYPTNGVVYNQDGTVQSFEVHLTHGKTPVGPNNPQTPGEPINPDNPDGPKWPEGTDKSSLTQTVIRTVNYLDKQTGKVVAKQVTEQVTYNRTAIVDKVTGQIIGYSTTGAGIVDQTDGDKAWTAVDNKSDWDSVTSPDLSSKGYLAPDLATVAQQTVTPGDKDVTVNVYYDHDVVPVNPTNPQTPDTPINPDDPDSPKWPAGTDKNSLTTDVHQTIHYQYGDGSKAAPDKTDSTTFDHQVEIDKVTGKIVKDDGWTAENGKTSFDSKNSPVIPGYTASKPASDSVDGLTHDSKDNVQTIIYTANQESAKVTYIDDTTGKTLSTKDLTGDYGSTDPYRTGDTIADYEKQGYQLVSDNYPTNGVVYNQDGTVQSFEVHLTHGTTQTSESQTVNETIHYVYKNGDKAADDYQATPLNFTRTVTTDKVTGDKSYGDWVAANGTSFASVTSPTIKGYTPDQAQIDTITGITADSADIEKTVTYVANKEAAKVTYIDDTTGKTLSSQDLSGDYGTTDSYRTADSIKGYEDQGYELVSDNYPTHGVVYNQDGTVQSFEVHLKHGTTHTSESKTVKETIHYVYKNGDKAADDYQATPLNFTRTVTTDKVTGDKSYGDWVAANGTSFASVTSPTIKGYTPDQAEIGSQTVSGDSKDLEFKVTYTKNAPTNPVNPSQPTTPTKPVNPSQPTTSTNPVNPSQPTTPTKPVNPSQPTTPTKPVNPSQPTTPTKPVNPSQPTTPTKPVQAGQAAATNFMNQRLPQTGETDQQHMTLSGLLLLAMSSLLGLFGMTKRQRKEQDDIIC